MRVLITGASRGIGAAVARSFADAYGSKSCISLVGRSLDAPSHPSLGGTLLGTAREVRKRGGTPVPLHADVRDADAVRRAVEDAVRYMGGVDVLVNNASALWMGRASAAASKKMDLVHSSNTRATLLFMEECRPHLERSDVGSIVTLSPPIRLGRLEWISAHVPYTLSKYGMTLSTLSMASDTLRANCVWPRHMVSTSATRLLEERGLCEGAWSKGRDPRDVAEAIRRVAESTTWNAQCLLDDEVLPLAPTDAPLDAFVEEK